jgi:hypothetical protein
VSSALGLWAQQVGRRKEDPDLRRAAPDHSHVVGLCRGGHQLPSYHEPLDARARRAARGGRPVRCANFSGFNRCNAVGNPGAPRVSRRPFERFRRGRGAGASRRRRHHELARFCERSSGRIEGEGTACEGQRGARDHFFQPRLSAPLTSGLMRLRQVFGGTLCRGRRPSARTRCPSSERLRQLTCLCASSLALQRTRSSWLWNGLGSNRWHPDHYPTPISRHQSTQSFC